LSGGFCFYSSNFLYLLICIDDVHIIQNTGSAFFKAFTQVKKPSVETFTVCIACVEQFEVLDRVCPN